MFINFKKATERLYFKLNYYIKVGKGYIVLKHNYLYINK